MLGANFLVGPWRRAALSEGDPSRWGAARWREHRRFGEDVFVGSGCGWGGGLDRVAELATLSPHDVAGRGRDQREADSEHGDQGAAIVGGDEEWPETR